MREKLDFMVRFWSLRARHEARSALTALERGELLSLLSLMVSDDPMPDRAPAPRGEGLPVQITARGGFLSAELRHVCAAGLVVTAAGPLALGQSTVVSIIDEVTGVEHAVPCVVEWTSLGTPTTMALRVDGAPTQLTSPSLAPNTWGASLGWSDNAWLPAA